MIVGRKREQKLLERAYESKEAEFITIYGRRRVGKTFLIREFFSTKKCTFFHATGVQKGTLEVQLAKFADALSLAFFEGTTIETPKKWSDAFGILQKHMAKTKGKIIIFLDELPWMATRKSGLLEELDYFWNRHWAGMRNVILVACGSSASWLIQKIIYNKGGLYNRTTFQIKLLPFTLAETDQFFKSKNIKLNHEHVLKLYMTFGGIPYYLRAVEPGLSAEQNIQRLIFDENAPLTSEYDRLFESLFDNAEAYRQIISCIAQRKEGVERTEIDKLSSGGRLTEKLQGLIDTGFIEEFMPWGRKRGEYYKVIDEFCLFYLHWVEPNKDEKFLNDFWIKQSQRPAYYAWSGYAFEAVCLKHIHQIVRALNIPTSTTVGSWRYIPPKKSAENGAQVDLVIDRTDDALTLCEIKYTEQPFAIDKREAERLRYIVDLFKKKTDTHKQIFISLVSAHGLKKTVYSEDMIASVATLKDLFLISPES